MKGEKRIKLINRLAYGVGDIFGGGGFFIISTFTMYFLINVAGLEPILAGLLIGLGKVWDALSDTFMGYISDRTRTKLGRRRIFFVIGIIPVIIAFIIIWIPIGVQSQIAKFVYYFFAYLFFYTTSTMVMVPYSALGAEMTTSFEERNKLSGTRLVFSMGSTLLAAVLAQPLIDAFPTQETGHIALGVAAGLICAVSWIIVTVGTWELPYDIQAKKQGENFLKNFATIFKNRTFRIHMGMYICSYAAMDILLSWMKFYLTDYLNMKSLLPIGLGTILLTQMIFLILYVRLANKYGKGLSYMTGLFIWGVGMLLFAFHTQASPIVIIIVNCVVIGAGLSAGVYIPWASLPFIIDIDEIITSKKRAGTYSGAMTLIRKLTQGALVLPMLGVLLTLIGYEQGAEVQTQDTLLSMKILFISIPVVLIALGIFFATKFRISSKNHAIIRAEIDRLRAGGSKDDSDTQTREVCETLTGIDYDDLFKEDNSNL